MVMADYFIPDKLQELWQQINHLHLTYLDTEDSPEKLSHRNKLEACIREYLCLAPHNRKFFCPETADVLHRSASSKKDFSGYRAALAWNALSMYAGNLLSQPWRKEYRQIKTYSGFYKHEIEANLVGADAMFEAMGYKHAADGILVLEGPICPDRVAHVSQDSLVAFVECQILKTIWEEVSNNFKISWLDVLEFRETHLCSIDQSIRILTYRLNEKRYHETHRFSVPESTPVSRYGNHNYQNHQNFSHVPPNYVHFSAPCAAKCAYSNYYSYAPYPPIIQTFQRYPFHQNGYIYPGNCLQNPIFLAHPVPTGQLIELENAQNCHDSVNPLKNDAEVHKNSPKVSENTPSSATSRDLNPTYESWDYVYKNLESQGYSKDLGERGDVLHDPKKLTRGSNRPPQKSSDPDPEPRIVIPSSGSQKVSRVPEKTRDFDDIDSGTPAQDNTHSQTAVKTHFSDPKPQVNGIVKQKPMSLTLPRDRQVCTPVELATVTLDPRRSRKNEAETFKLKSPKSRQKKVSAEAGKTWNCNACTYLNLENVEICVMCGKSRRNVEVVMQVGGAQCPACTLVNPKEADSCQACDTSLQNSATYI